MRINFFTDSYGETNGVTTTLDSWKDRLEERGHKVSIVGPGDEADISVNTLPLLEAGEEYELGLPSEIMAESEIPEADIVHTHGQVTMGLLGAWQAENEEVTRIATHHTPLQHYDDYLKKDSFPEFINKYIGKFCNSLYDTLEELSYTEKADSLYPSPELITAPTGIASEDLERRIGREVETLSNGIDTDFYRETSSDLLGEEGIDTDKPVAGYCGRIGWEKNLENIAELASIFDGEIVVAGEGGATRKLIPELEEAGVNYLGWLEEEKMPEFYSSIDVLLQPSDVETQGKTVLEANSCGTPAVGANAMALRETIREGVNGRKYQTGNIEEMENEVSEALENDMQTRKYVKNNQDLEQVIDQLEEIYLEHS